MHSETSYKQCTRCVMDTSDPDIYFDEVGNCQHCTTLLNILHNPKYRAHFNAEGFSKLVQKMKRAGSGKKYDCILGISGGADSCYLAYLLYKSGLRVLLVHMDNGWNSEESVRNIRAVVDRLNFDYESVVLDWEEFKDIQLSFLKASIIEAETPTDIAILGALHQMSMKYSVKYIVSGSNLATEGILPYSWHYNAKDEQFIYEVQRRFGEKKIKSLPLFGFWKEVWSKFFRRIQIIYPLNYFSFDKEDAIAILEKELQWRPYGGKHHESRYTKFIQGYLLPLKFNIDYRKATYSSQICSATLDRDEAVQKLTQPSYNKDEIEREKSFVAKKLSISNSELEAILALPPKSFQDYPNNQKRLEFWYRLYRKFFKGSWRSLRGSAVTSFLFLA